MCFTLFQSDYKVYFFKRKNKCSFCSCKTVPNKSICISGLLSLEGNCCQGEIRQETERASWRTIKFSCSTEEENIEPRNKWNISARNVMKSYDFCRICFFSWQKLQRALCKHEMRKIVQILENLFCLWTSTEILSKINGGVETSELKKAS